MKLTALILGVGLLLQASAASRCSGAAPEPAQVELDIFSGRPNPTWKLSEEETSQLLGLLGNLPSTETQRPEPGLGYRGFVVSFRDSTARIYGGTVERSVGESSEFFADKDRALERWLVKNSGSRLSPDLYEIVAKEVS
jgi:hypothetical protein